MDTLSLREKSRETLQKLIDENTDAASRRAAATGGAEQQQEGEELRYWVDKSRVVDDVVGAPSSSSRRCRFFQRNGFLHVPSFCSIEECANMKRCMFDLVDREWQPDDAEGDGVDSFGTNSRENRARGDYFLNSAESVHFFAESCSLMTEEGDEEDGKDGEGADEGGCCDSDGKGSAERKKRRQSHRRKRLRPEYRRNKMAALNKCGHALHTQVDAFREYSFSGKLLELVLDLGWKDPVLPQSMYIFKQPHIGG